jgi:N-acylneuraminate cytidylyltransferase
MKAHSERVPHKNVRDFNGKPLYRWVLDTLLDSAYITNVIINTDNIKIIDEVKDIPKVMAVKRPAELCGDFVAMNKIIEYDMSLTDSEYFLQTHATNPLLKAGTIDSAIEIFFENQATHDSLFSVIQHQSRFYRKDGTPLNHDPKKMIRSQDNEPIFEENSNIFIFSKTSFYENHHNRVGRTPYMFPMGKIESTDIDEEEDFAIAKALHELDQRGGR